MKKKIEIIPIAEKKINRRGISSEIITETVISPSQITKGYGGRKVAQKKIIMNDKEYLLRVIYEENQKSIIIVTAYLTSKIGRYWEEI